MTSRQYAPPVADELQEALRAEQVRLLFETQFFNIGATLVITAIVALTLLPGVDLGRILLWSAVMLICNGIRAAITICWRRDTHWLLHRKRWQRMLILGALLGGSGWGVGNILLFPAQNSAQQMLLVFVTCGISAAAAVSLSVDRLVAWCFLIPCTLPLEWKFLTYSKDVGLGLATMGLVYIAFMAAIINRLYNHIRDNVALRHAEGELEQLHSEYAQALRSSQEKLQALFELSPLGCALMRSDGTLVEVNQALHRMLGYTADEIERLFASRAPVYREENRQGWEQLVNERGSDSLECELRRKDGSPISVSLHRMVIDTGDGQHYVWSLVEDITARKHNEEQLQALNNRLSLATQAGGIGVWELDLVNNVLLWDARTCEIYGIEPVSGPVPLEAPGSIAHPEDWARVWDEFRTALIDRNIDHQLLEYRVLWPDDTERVVRTAGHFSRDENGRTLRVIGVVWDITDIKRVERMKTEFVSTVSHELRTPLTSIRGSLGLVAGGVAGELPPPARDLIEVAYKNSERLSVLINDILDIEKIESGKMRLDIQAQPLQPLLEQTVLANQGFAQNFNTRLTLRGETDAVISVDTNRFMQIMANLISNAVKFTSAENSVEVAIIDAIPQVRIEVRDRGPGISADFRERIFQRFSQADSSDTRARGGSGLGLAITKAFVEKMRGAIGFADREGGGTVFFVEFPRQ